MPYRRLAALGALVVTANLLIGAAHMLAHLQLGVRLAPWQDIFVSLVVVTSPIAAAVLVRTPLRRIGASLLAGSMAGALVFSTYFHYILVSPDHVAHLPEGDLRWLFRLTAGLLLVAQGLGVAIGMLMMKAIREGTWRT
ncbi:MAG TPA: hypothetical protein QGG47_01020 [Acidobacteriota bacterium]|nr:hypothetical protein [Acidobacteriota bacterium]